MIDLIPPNLEPENIDQHVTCIRPKRTGGARIECELRHGKLIIHNYGHGGFGWSLLPGSVKHAVALFQQSLEQNQALVPSRKITVLGAGWIGLLTALSLYERGWDVTIIAEHMQPLASHKAAGSVAAIAIKASRDNQPLMDQVAVDSYLYYKELPFPGIAPIPVYMVHIGTPDYRYPLVATGVMPKPEEVMINFGNGVNYKAKKFDTFSLQTVVLMNALTAKIFAYNIPIVKQKIVNFSEIQPAVVFNCTGLGARAWDSNSFIPVQGHLVKVKDQPLESLRYIIYAHIKIDGRLKEISWTPNGGGILGGSAINYEDRLDANPEQSEAIMRRARIFFCGH